MGLQCMGFGACLYHLGGDGGLVRLDLSIGVCFWVRCGDVIIDSSYTNVEPKCDT